MTSPWTRHWSRGPADIAERFNALTATDAAALLRESGLNPVEPPRCQGSVENRVYTVVQPSSERAILKVYRPGRWSRAGLAEELEFLADLRRADVPVVRPLELPSGDSIGSWSGLDFVVYAFVETEPMAPEWDATGLRALGRLAARIHAIGRERDAPARMTIDAAGFGRDNLDYLAHGELIPRALFAKYEALATALIDELAPLLAPLELHRVHGDLGIHNLLASPSGELVVADFDDFMRGPIAFDLCRLHVGLRTEWGDPVAADALEVRAKTFDCLLAGYRELAPLSEAELRPLVGLRGLRMIWNDAWKQARLHDANFRAVRRVIFEPAFWHARLAELRSHLDGFRASLE